MNPLHVYEIDDGAQHSYVAASADEALQLFVDDQYGGSIEDYRKDYPDTTVEQCADDKSFTIDFDPDHEGSDEGWEETKTCGEWAAERGPGFLASSEW